MPHPKPRRGFSQAEAAHSTANATEVRGPVFIRTKHLHAFERRQVPFMENQHVVNTYWQTLTKWGRHFIQYEQLPSTAESRRARTPEETRYKGSDTCLPSLLHPKKPARVATGRGTSLR